jgi:hypothetical protein
MTYQLQLAAVATPESDLEVFPFMNKLRQEAGEQAPSALLKRFHDALAALFPDTPWSEGHYAGNAGRLTVERRRKVVVPHVLYLAQELGLTVVDNQSGEVHRPPTYQVVLEGPVEGVGLGDAANRLAALTRKPVTEMLALLSGGRRTVVKKGVPRFQARQYAAALRERAGCHATLALEPGVAAHPEPPPPKKLPPPAAPQAPLNLDKARPTAPSSALALDPVVAPSPAAGSAVANPALPPRASREQEKAAAEELARNRRLYVLADGVRLTIYATVLYLITGYFYLSLAGWPKIPLSLGITALSMVAVYRLAKGAGSNIAMRILAVILVFIPLANILVLLLMIRRGKVVLRNEGIATNWLGAEYHELCAMRGAANFILPSTIVGWLAALSVGALIALGRQAADKQVTAMIGTHPQPCAMVGIWKSSKIGPDGALLLDQDGKYYVMPQTGKESAVKQEQGRWKVVNHTIWWEMPLPDKPWISTTQVQTFKMGMDGRTITMFEMEKGGLFTELHRIGDMESPRCAIK